VHPSRLIINLDESLLRALNSPEWGRPLALGTVVREAVERREMIGIKEFEGSEGLYKGRAGWSISPWGVLRWGFQVLGLGGQADDKMPVGQFVVIPNLEDAGMEAAGRIEGFRGRTEKVLSRIEFRDEFSNILGEGKILSESDFQILLRFLERDKGVLLYNDEIVKLKAPGVKDEITQEDSTIVSLKTLIRDLQTQTKVLTQKADELTITAKEAVTRKNRLGALAALRSKKLAESTLEKRHATLAQLEEVFIKIEQAADQVALVRVMEASTRVLTGLNKEVGGVDRVDDVVDNLREQMSQVDEVGNVIAEAGRDNVAVDETEVDDELEAMEQQEKAKVEAKERKEREEREKREAEETKRKLHALEAIENKAKESAAKSAEDENVEEDLNRSTELLWRVNLDESEPISETS
jgi:charged multivesicular body protein 7